MIAYLVGGYFIGAALALVLLVAVNWRIPRDEWGGFVVCALIWPVALTILVYFVIYEAKLWRRR